MLFAGLLSLHLVTFLMFFILVHVTFFSSRCMLELKFAILQQVSPHRLPMQYCLKNHWPDQAFFKHSPHTNSISNSAILCNNYISLLSDLCACVHVKKIWRRKGSHSSSVSGSNHLVWLQTCEKAMGWWRPTCSGLSPHGWVRRCGSWTSWTNCTPGVCVEYESWD